LETQVTDKETEIWKALADPTRRRLMDLVRESPKTTGDLVEEFESIGRCAVMKHLSILEEAGLVIGRKDGRNRWNYINAIPLQEIYERWVKKYEAQWATNLLQLRELAEYKEHIDDLTNDLLMKEPTKPVNIRLEVPIDASINNVWECLIKDIGLWWRKDFYTSPKTKAFILEPKVGGRMYEDYGNDEGLLWYTVIVLNAPFHLEMQGHLTPDYGGPAITFLKITLKEDGGKTSLILSDTLMGDVSAKAKGQITEGWKLLFEEGFKNYADNKS
jgi:DNA-binding transcriptional ArsR family regulator/uncharacterized protein YndB with AHSA1/START domain